MKAGCNSGCIPVVNTGAFPSPDQCSGLSLSPGGKLVLPVPWFLPVKLMPHEWNHKPFELLPDLSVLVYISVLKEEFDSLNDR